MEQLSIGNGGWVRYESNELSFPVFVRFVQADDGRLVPVDLFLTNDQEHEALSLREVPFGRIQAWVNVEPDDVLRKIAAPGPDLRTLISWFSRSVGSKKRPDHNSWAENWVTRSFAAQLGIEPRPKTWPLSDLLDPAPPVDESDALLNIPISRPYGDDFYREVASVYARLAGRVRAASGLIADANHVNLTQVHRWVKVARAKEFLPAGRVGKAG